MSLDDFIDVRQRMATFSVEELCATADEYFRRLENWDYLLAKPLAQVSEAPELLQCFAHVVQGLQLAPGMTVVDFGLHIDPAFKRQRHACTTPGDQRRGPRRTSPRCSQTACAGYGDT